MTDFLPPPPADPAADGPAAPAAPVAPRRSGAGQWIALACALVVLLAAGGGLAWVAFVHHDSGPKPWAAPADRRTGSYGSLSGGAHYGKLAKLLLPVPHGWLTGPDVNAFGADTTISAARADAMTTSELEADLGHLTAAQRRQAAAAVRRLHIKGIGLRSFQDTGSRSVVQISLEQVSTQYARASERELTELFAEIGTKGPRIPGHPEAHCSTDWTTQHGLLRDTYCSAGEGDLMVDVTLQTVRGAGTTQALALVAHQLDRIADPGESV